MKALRDDFEADEKYITFDYNRYVSAGVLKEEGSNFFERNASHTLSVQDVLDNYEFDFSLLDQELFKPVALSLNVGPSSVEKIEVNMYKTFWMTSFKNRSKVSYDQFVYNLALYGQVYAT